MINVIPHNKGEHYRTLAQRITEIAGALGYTVTTYPRHNFDPIRVAVAKGQKLWEWTGAVQGRTDDQVVKQFSLWLASVR